MFAVLAAASSYYSIDVAFPNQPTVFANTLLDWPLASCSSIGYFQPQQAHYRLNSAGARGVQ